MVARNCSEPALFTIISAWVLSTLFLAAILAVLSPAEAVESSLGTMEFTNLVPSTIVQTGFAAPLR
jgi:hypothetical protein